MELLAPAGGIEQLRAAVLYGADAVYLATDRFGMRQRAINFALEDLPETVAFAHAAGVKVYVTVNILMFDSDIDELPAYFRALADAGVDAFIIGDIGAASVAHEVAPEVAIHVSTQASVANARSARVWHDLGATRIVCARELSLEQLAVLRREMPADMELEVFVHGAMCMAVSGRCLISSYLTGRSGNRGHCTQPCRWNYTVMAEAKTDASASADAVAPIDASASADYCDGGSQLSLYLEEEKRPGQYFPIEQDEHGTYIMNAKDLNMLAYLDKLREIGVDSVKIEGRNKKAFYVASVVRAYRQVLDGTPASELADELMAVSHRPYSTGFYFGSGEQADDYDGYEQTCLHVADLIKCDGGLVSAICRNRFSEGDELEVLSPHGPIRTVIVRNLTWHPDATETGFLPTPEPVAVANRTSNLYTFAVDEPIEPGSYLRARTFRRSARSGA